MPSFEGPLVGREQPWASLMRGWQAVAEGAGALVLVTGEQGSGKSRLLLDFAQFVVSQEDDLMEIVTLLGAIGLPVPADRVLLMPEGTDSVTLDARGRWLVDICKRTGYRFCPRVQIHLFGHTRGT